jgi:hypothetical protein
MYLLFESPSLKKKGDQGGNAATDYQHWQLVIGGVMSFVLVGLFLIFVATDLRIGETDRNLAMFLIGLGGLVHLLIAFREISSSKDLSNMS